MLLPVQPSVIIIKRWHNKGVGKTKTLAEYSPKEWLCPFVRRGHTHSIATEEEATKPWKKAWGRSTWWKRSCTIIPWPLAAARRACTRRDALVGVVNGAHHHHRHRHHHRHGVACVFTQAEESINHVRERDGGVRSTGRGWNSPLARHPAIRQYKQPAAVDRVRLTTRPTFFFFFSLSFPPPSPTVYRVLVSWEEALCLSRWEGKFRITSVCDDGKGWRWSVPWLIRKIYFPGFYFSLGEQSLSKNRWTIAMNNTRGAVFITILDRRILEMVLDRCICNRCILMWSLLFEK